MKNSTDNPSSINPVLTEVWRIKEEIAAEHGYDIRKIATAAIEAQNQHPGRVVDRSTTKKKTKQLP